MRYYDGRHLEGLAQNRCYSSSTDSVITRARSAPVQACRTGTRGRIRHCLPAGRQRSKSGLGDGLRRMHRWRRTRYRRRRLRRCNPRRPRESNEYRSHPRLAVGFSMGAWFTYALACQRSGMIEAIAPVGGLMPRPVAALSQPASPLGALVIFGDNDQTQPYNGTAGAFGLFADSSAIFWSKANHCSVQHPDDERTFGSTRVRLMIHEDCDGGTTIERHRVIGLPHVWPSGNYGALVKCCGFSRRTERCEGC